MLVMIISRKLLYENEARNYSELFFETDDIQKLFNYLLEPTADSAVGSAYSGRRHRSAVAQLGSLGNRSIRQCGFNNRVSEE